jgi:hypothetical protein
MTPPAQGSLVTPSINILGAYFPDWMFAIAGGAALTGAARLALSRVAGIQRLGWFTRALLYLALATLLALLGWLLLFTD